VQFLHTVAYVLEEHAASILRVDEDTDSFFPPKRRCPHTKIHGNTTHKTTILKSLKIYPVLLENK
jgi:hypothetical protein